MSLLSVAARNVLRNKGRTVLTVLAASIAILAFMFLRTMLAAWQVGIDAAAKDRIATRHKVTFILPLPKKYIEDIRGVSGVKAATFASWFGGKDPKDEKNFFATLAVESKTFFDVLDEMEVDPKVKEAWIADRQGVILGDVLAQKLNVKPGDSYTLSGTIYPKRQPDPGQPAEEWVFHVVGTYKATRKSVDRSQFIFHWDYLNDSIPPARRDQIGWVIARIDDPSRSPTIIQSIDKLFDDRDVQTVTMSEKAMNLSFLAGFSAILTALDLVSVVILLIMTLVVGNTIAMGVRERTNEYGVLRAIGFQPKHIAMFVIGEAATIGLLSGVFGAAISYFLLDRGLGPALEDNLGAWFPYFRIPMDTMVIAVVGALVLAVLASIIPAYKASTLKVTEALRRVA